MPKRKKVKILPRTQWFKITRFFNGVAKKTLEIGENNVIVQGTVNELEYGNARDDIEKCIDDIKAGDTEKAIETLTAIANNHSPVLAVCSVPTQAISNVQGEALRGVLSANLRLPTMLLSNNIQLARLKPISEDMAKRIMSDEGKVLAEEK